MFRVIGGAVLLVVAWAIYWWLAVPRHEICAMTMPAPAGCDSGRVPVAALWSVVTGGFYVMLLLRGQRSRTLGAAGLFVTAVCGYFSVLYG